MNTYTVTITAAAGTAAGPWLRGLIFSHATAYGRPRRTQCPRCRHPAGTGPLRRLPTSGRCPQCARRLGPPRLAVEACTAAVLALTAWQATSTGTLIALSALGIAAVVLSFVDIAVHRLPNVLVASTALAIAAVIAAGAVTSQQWNHAVSAAVSAAICGSIYLLMAIALPGIGFGDVKWAAVLAMACGWFGLQAALLSLLLGAVFAAATAAVAVLAGQASQRTVLPAGPPLSAGALAAIALCGS